MTKSDTEFIADCFDLLPDTPPPPSISDYIQGRRVLPTNTPFPGPWDNARTPYFVEIMDDLSPYSPVQHVVLMKSRKVGATTCSENVVGYWMDANPTEIEYLTASEDLALDWATRKIPPLIDSLGFRDKITSQTENPKSRMSGDRTFRKEYIGGCLDICSSRSLMAKRAGDKRILIRDEIDGVPTLTTTGEGNWLEVNEGHTISWGARKKIFDFSSPTTVEASNIAAYYEMGDCRKFYVPCPHCGTMQELEFGNDSTEWGLKADMAGDELIQAYYVCKNDDCRKKPHGGKVFNSSKTDMLGHGKWQPTKKSNSATFRSYHISAMYSPVGMMSFTELYQKYLEAIREGPDGMRSFVNLYLGLPFSEVGSRPKLSVVMALQGTYPRATVPDGVLYLTCGIDVQRGSGMDPADPSQFKDPAKPPRLELEILGTGSAYRTWSIDYLRFEGDITDPYSGAWEKLYQWAQNGGLIYKRADGTEFKVQMVFVDSGDGTMSDIVYAFCERWANTFPIKGLPIVNVDPHRSRAENEGPREVWYRHANIGGPRGIYEINTRHYKRIIYSHIEKIKREPVGPQRPGFCDFPRDYDEHYFAGLCAEEQLSDGSFFCPSGRRNEPLDTRVYAMCAADVWLDQQVELWRKYFRENGASQAQVQQTINSKWVLDEMARKIGKK